MSAKAHRQAATGIVHTKTAADGAPTERVVAAIPEHPHAGKRENRSRDRNASPLTGRTRLSQRRKSDEAAGDCIEWAGQTIEQFAADMAK